MITTEEKKNIYFVYKIKDGIDLLFTEVNNFSFENADIFCSLIEDEEMLSYYISVDETIKYLSKKEIKNFISTTIWDLNPESLIKLIRIICKTRCIYFSVIYSLIKDYFYKNPFKG